MTISGQNHDRNTVCNEHDARELTDVMLSVLTMRMNDQHHSFGPLVNSTVD